MNKNDTDKDQSSNPLKRFSKPHRNSVFAGLMFMLISMAIGYFGTASEITFGICFVDHVGQNQFTHGETSLKSIDGVMPATSVFMGEVVEEEVEDEHKKHINYCCGTQRKTNLSAFLAFPNQAVDNLYSSLPAYLKFCCLKLLS